MCAAGLFTMYLLGAGGPGVEVAPVAVRAYVTTAGPYGESWELKVAPDGKVSLDIRYMLDPMGKMSGDFLVPPERVAALRDVLVAQRFDQLPRDISPDSVPFHRPDLRLSVTVGDRIHEVRLYDPAQFEADPRVRRFLAVWEQVFAMVPLRPRW